MLKDRIYYFDYLRFFAATAVILSHVADEFVYYPWQITEMTNLVSAFNIGNFFDSIARFAVHIFFFISGALLLNNNINFKLKKAFLRLFLALVFYSTFYPIVIRYLQDNNIDVNIQELKTTIQMTTFTNFSEFFSNTVVWFLKMPIVFHLWFLYRMLSNYLAVPFLRVITAMPDEKKRKQIIEYSLVLWFLLAICLPTSTYFFPDFWIRVKADFMPAYLGPMLLGYYLHTYPIKINKFLLVIMWVVSNFLMMLGIHIENLIKPTITTGKHFNVWSYNNEHLFVVLNAVSIFLMAKYCLNRKGLFYDYFIEPFSRTSFQTYLIHILVLSFVFDLWPSHDYFFANPWFTIPITTITTLFISYLYALMVDYLFKVPKIIFKKGNI